MARLVLHIGTHKTATTTVQDTFHASHALLAEHGVIYPALGNHTGHHGLLTDWIGLPAAYALPDGGLGTLRALAAKYVDSDKTLFLSSEEFSRGGGAGGQVDMAALAQIFKGYQSIQIICFLREQWQFLQSVYLELARTRTPDRPPMLIEAALNTGMVDGLWCDYRALYDHLLTGFSPKDIHFVGFGDARAQSGGVLGVLLSFLNLPFDADRLVQVNGGASNISGLPLPSWAAFAIAGGHPTSPLLSSSVQTTFDLEYGDSIKTCLFTRDEMNKIATHFTPLNTELAARIAVIQPGFQIPSTQPAAGTIHREDITESFWLRAARRIFLSTETLAHP